MNGKLAFPFFPVPKRLPTHFVAHQRSTRTQSTVISAITLYCWGAPLANDGVLVAIRNMLNVNIFIVNVGCGDNASEVPEFVGGRHGNKTQALVFVYPHNQIQLAYINVRYGREQQKLQSSQFLCLRL